MFWSLEQDIINFLLSYLLKFCLRSTFSFNLGLTASLTLEGGGVGDFGKKNSCKHLLGEKNCMQHKEKRKKFLHCYKQGKNVVKLFHHSWGALQNPSKTATIPDNLQASKPLWLAY